MIDGLQAAIAKINHSIPREILEIVFGKPDYSQSIDRSILDEVLLPRMRDDISIRGGTIMKIVLLPEWIQKTNSPTPHSTAAHGMHSVYHIPPEYRELRDISCVLRVRRPHLYQHAALGQALGYPYVGNSLVQLSRAALDAQTGANTLPVPTATVRPGNVIILNPPQFTSIGWSVAVRLKYDDNFSGMDVSLIGPFADLCLAAVEHHIYTKMVVPIESNMVYRGADLGVIKEIITGDYKDAKTRYDELLLTFGGAEFLAIDRFRDFAQYIVGTV